MRNTQGVAASGAPDLRLQPAGTASRLTSVLLSGGVPAAAVSAATIGGVYLAAWLVGAAARWSAAGVITMKANMALSLVMAGVALLLVDPRRTTPERRVLGTLLATLVVLVGSMTLLEHVLQAEFGIDQLLATEAPGAVATARPNRLGPPGSISLMLLGAGLIALAWRRYVACYFALATAVIVLIPAIGFVSGIVEFYAGTVSNIAWPTVIALLLLAGGIHLAEAPRGPLGLAWRDDPGGRVLRQLLPIAVLAPLVLHVLQHVGAHQGLYDHETGIGILLLSFILVLSTVLWRGAQRVSTEAARLRVAEAEVRWRADLIDLVQDAILIWSPSGGIEHWNRGAQETYGYTSHEALGRSPHVLLRTEPPRGITAIEQEVLRVGRWKGELRHWTHDGRQVVVSSTLVLVRGVDGSDRILEVNRDITARKQMEDELRESSSAKDDFLSLLSHELRNPLTPIRNSLHVLEHADPSGQQARRAKEIIGRQVGHLARLVDDLLEVTRITRGKVQLRRARVDLNEIVRRTGDDYRDLMKSRGLVFSATTHDGPVWVDGDETRLAQVIGNLLQNAAKFTPAGGRVTLSAVALDASEAEVRVADTGVGIAPALIGQVFEPFVQAEQTLARTEGGLGLGLALVKSIVQLHGGRVEVRSGGEGHGAEFVVRVPILDARDSERTDGVAPNRPRRVLRVLIVEDNADAAESLAEVVRMYGHEVDVAPDGPTAISKACAVPPHLVLCDIGLPGMDGYDVARALGSNPNLKSTRLIALTGYAHPEDVQRAIEAGFVGHIPKPPELSALERYLVTG